MKKTPWVMSLVFAAMSAASGGNTCGNTCENDAADYQLQYKMDYHKTTPCKPKGCQPSSQFTPKDYRLQYHSRYVKQPRDNIQQHKNTVHKRKAGSARATVTPNFKVVFKDRIGRFNNIVVDGHTIVHINQGTPRGEIQLKTKEVYPTKLIDYGVRNGTLFLSRFAKRNWNKEAQQPVHVYINAPSLHNITASRGAVIVSRNIKGDHMSLHMKDTGNLSLRGNFDISSIVTEGYGKLNIEWIKSHHLDIIQKGTATLRLAGRVNVLNVRAIDHVVSDLQYLRAKNAVVQTADSAVVKVTALNNLAGFASDFSNIMYFKTPHHMNRHNYGSGNVMQVRHWD